MTCPKVKYSSEQMALEDIKRIQKRSKRARVPISAYHCKCGAWHITSKDDTLYDKIIALQEEIVKMAAEVKSLKAENLLIATRHRKSENVEIRADERVKQLQSTLKKQIEINKKLHQANNELCGRIARLEYIKAATVIPPGTYKTNINTNL